MHPLFLTQNYVPGFQDSSKTLRHTDFFLFYIWKRLIQRNNESMRQWLVYSQGQYTDWACVWETKLNNPKRMPLRPRLPSQSQTVSPGSRRLRPEDRQAKKVKIPSQKTHLGETWNSLLPLCGLVTSSPAGWDHSEEKKFHLLSLSSHPLRHTYSKGRGRQITTTRFCFFFPPPPVYVQHVGGKKKNPPKSRFLYCLVMKEKIQKRVFHDMKSFHNMKFKIQRKEKKFKKKFKFLWRFYQNCQSNASLQATSGCFHMQQQRW